MELSPERRAALLELTRCARAQLESELDLGLTGMPLAVVRRHVPPAVTAPAVVAAPTAPTRSQLSAESTQSTKSPAPAAAMAIAAVAGPEKSMPVAAASDSVDAPTRLRVLAQEAAACKDCVLHEKRNKSVFSRGSEQAELVFVGEGPGRDEDLQGQPFVGAAGQLLDRMISAMGYGREDVYICNVVKCRPPENRTPRPEEALACSRFLIPQLHAVAPKAIVALGRCAAQALGVAEAAGPWRGRWGKFQGIAVLPTYHPAFLLRSPEQKRVVWEDLQLVMSRLGKSLPPRRG